MGKNMIQFRESAGVVIAADVQGAVSSVDDALLNGARMWVSVLEAFQGAKVPAGQSQKLFETLTSGINSMLAGRKDMVAAIRHLTQIQGRSNLAAEAYGCPEGWAMTAAEPGSIVQRAQPVA
jgi:hypothetical protein